jgi:signal transduction histidine kinase
MRFRFLLYASLVLFGTSVLIALSYNYGIGEISSAKRMQRIFIEKYKQTEFYVQSIADSDFENVLQIGKEASEKNISLLIYKHEKLEFWSDNNVPIINLSLDTLKDGLLELVNSKYYRIVRKIDNKHIIGLIKLENSYPYRNKFLLNGIIEDFKVKAGKICTFCEGADIKRINTPDGTFAFSVNINQEDPASYHFGYTISTFLIFLGFIFLLLYFRQFLLFSDFLNQKLRFLIVFFALVIFKVSIHFSESLRNHLYLFDPFIYASKVAPTFGDLILNSLYFLFLIYLFYKFVKVPEKYLNNSFNSNAWIGIANVIYILVILIVQQNTIGIIQHSGFEVVIHNISQISIPIVISYVLFGINYLSVFLIGLWIYKTLSKEKSYIIIINCSVLLFLLFIVTNLAGVSFDIYSVLFGILLLVLIGFMRKQLFSNTISSSLVLFLLFFTIYISVFTSFYSKLKSIEKKESYAISLSNEHDPIAEYIFEEISREIKEDQSLISYLEPEGFDNNKLHNYLIDNYFTGYLKKYNLGVIVCRPSDSLLIENPDINWYPCYDYFQYIFHELGIQIPLTEFYYIDDYTGLISYIGWLKINNSKLGEISLFLELDSKLTTETLGYPELLLDERLQETVRNERISYAKYHRGELISHSGSYEYSLNSSVFETEKDKNLYFNNSNNYSHLVYRPEQESVIVISEQNTSPIELLVLFSYIFVFYYLISLLIIFLLVSRFRTISFKNSLRNKIQFSVILVLLASLLLIAGSTIWFNVRKYNQTQVRILTEKIQSVYVELEHKLSYEEVLTPDWSTEKYNNLEQLLIKFSDVFYSDINLYNPKGDLIASSRPEIFELGLQNLKMTPQAYYKMNNLQLAKFIHREKINSLSYLSAYIPFVNVDGQLLAYLNLPYFTKQKELQEDITTLTVAIVNIYVLLILITIIVVVVISNQITKPLEMLQSKFKLLKLGGKYEQINYDRQDEIGRLVNEYNRMVRELEKSVKLLAKSERETAWREMAKQVAHEIKNPLTPMRLSVQQLQRAWGDKKENFETYLNRVTNTLIEQIDNLSTIASEFSNFAKMPTAKIEDVNLTDILLKACSLFKDNQHIKIMFASVGDPKVVQADSEQLLRVFINIIKNGIQAIPEEKEGALDIKLKYTKSNAVIEFSDNGKGIPKDIRSKLFMPNFTTKTSGMGLGLAIVKNTLEQIGGSITFNTKINVGSTFVIKIPVI